MINVANIHAVGTAWQTRGLSALDKVHKAQKHDKKAARPMVKGVPAAGAVTTKQKPKPVRPQTEFSTDWRTSPEYNPHGLPPEQVVHPDPVNANRMKAFSAAAQSLAAHADARVNEMRNQGK